MGIRGLTKLITTSPSASGGGVTRVDRLDTYRGKAVAFDASLHIYQFMTVRGENKVELRDASGAPTTHLQGLLSRACRLLKAGIRPVFVFDGEAPGAKAPLLQKRNEIREKAAAQAGGAQAGGSSYRLSRRDTEDCKRLLQLLGIPVVQSPSEAEAQCAELCRTGLVYGVSTEDMDTLAFGSPVVIRSLFAPPSSASSITEYSLAPIISGLGLVSHAQFIDVCILCGCDYCGTIPGIGPVKALLSIKQHENIEGVLGALMASNKVTHEALSSFGYRQARQLFMYPSVIPAAEVARTLCWAPPQEQAVLEFLVAQKGFNADRVKKFLALARQGALAASQTVIDAFFTPADAPCAPPAATGGSSSTGSSPCCTWTPSPPHPTVAPAPTTAGLK